MSGVPVNCPSCGASLLTADEVCPFCGEVVGPPPPTAASPDAESAPAPANSVTVPPPWEVRREHGFWRALWLTWRASVFSPVPFFRQLPPRGGLGPALGYTVLLSAVALLFSLYWSLIEGALAGNQEGGALVLTLGSIVMSVLWLAIMIPLYVGLLFAMVGVLHLSFSIVGAGHQGFEATFRAVSYSSGPAAFAVFPFFGPLLSLIWGSVLIFIAAREAQRTTNGRAAAAFLLPLIALFLLLFVLVILLAVLVGSADLGVPAAA